jgi:hypothetical protein
VYINEVFPGVETSGVCLFNDQEFGTMLNPTAIHDEET